MSRGLGDVYKRQIKNQDAVTKIIDMAPDLISRFTGKKEEDGYTAEKVEHIINQEADKE